MTSARQKLCAALADMAGVELMGSHFGSGGNPAWRAGGREFAHLHSDTLLDLRLPSAVQSRLRGDARAHFRAGRSHWVEVEFHSAQDVADLLVFVREAVAAAQGGD